MNWPLVLALLVAAGGLLVADHQFDRYAHGNLPERRLFPDPEFGFTFRSDWMVTGVNDEGFRTDAVPAEKARGEFRLLCIGDSFTAGCGVPESDIYPSLLQKNLQKRLPDRTVRVVNLAVDGYTMGHMARVLRVSVDRYHADAALVVFYPEDGLVDRPQPVPAWRLAFYRLMYRSAIYRYLALRMRRVDDFGEFPPLNPYEPSDVFHASAQNLQAMAQTAAEHGIPILFAVEFCTDGDPAAAPRGGYSRLSADCREAVEQSTTRTGHPLLWLGEMPPFRDAEPGQVLMNPGHLNVEGHNSLAEVLADELVRRKIAPTGVSAR